jgi:hypothetical protein
MNRTSSVRKQNSSGHFSPKSPDCLPDGSGSLIRIEQKTFAVSEPVTHYRMHSYRSGNLRDEIPKEGDFGPPRAVTPWKKKTVLGRAMAQVVSRRLLTTEARVRSQVKSM